MTSADTPTSRDLEAAKQAGEQARAALHLTPTEDLILTLLVSRRRLGEGLFLLDRRHRKALRSLADKGLIRHENGSPAPGADKVFLTSAGLVVGMDPALTTPLTAPRCPSFYLGPQTGEHRVDCTRRNHHGGKHRATTYRARRTKPGPAKAVEVEVKWTDAQAGGLDSVLFREQITRQEVERREAIEASVAKYRPNVNVEDYL